jgi:hypothetical protein
MLVERFNEELILYNNTMGIFKNNSEFDESKVLRKKPEYNFSGAYTTYFLFSKDITRQKNEKSNLNILMGFDEKKDYGSVPALSGYSIYAPSIYNLCYSDKLYLQSNIVGENNKNLSSNILQSLYLYNIQFG